MHLHWCNEPCNCTIEKVLQGLSWYDSSASDETTHLSVEIQLCSNRYNSIRSITQRFEVYLVAVTDTHIYLCFVPLQILSDQGRNFESALFQELCKLLDMRTICTS